MTRTRDSIMAMTPEQLREAIAKAKGWRCIVVDHGDFSRTIWWDKPDGTSAPTLPDWPTNIANAWELVDEIRASGCELRIDTDRNGGGADIYSVAIMKFRGDGRGTGWTQVVEAEAPTAPFAISRCWLMWKEKE